MLFFGPQAALLLIGCFALGAGAATLFFFLMNRRKPNAKKNVLVEGLRENAQRFEGMYEPVYSIAVGKHEMQQQVFAAWNESVSACEDDDAGFREAFANKFGDYYKWGQKKKKVKIKKANKIYNKKANQLVKLFFRAGIIREHDKFIVGDEKNAACYEIVGGGNVEPGISYEVLAPYWHLGETVLDQGAVR